MNSVRTKNRRNIDKHSGDSLAPKNSTIIYGKHPVLATILQQKRQLFKLLLTQNAKKSLDNFLRENSLSLPRQLKILSVEKKVIDDYLPDESIHQGFLLFASKIRTYNIDEFAAQCGCQTPPLIILDQLSDPHNIGSIIRSSAAFGVKNILTTNRNTIIDSPIIAKSSAGLVEIMNITLVNNINNSLLFLKKMGYWCIALDGEAKINLKQALQGDISNNVALIFGNEGEGVRRLVKKNCDLLAKIPMQDGVESLNVSNAAAIALYELYNKLNES